MSTGRRTTCGGGTAQAARVRSIRGTWERIAVDEKMEKTQYVCVCVSALIFVMIYKIFLELFEAQVIIDIPMILLVVAGLSSSFNLEPGTG